MRSARKSSEATTRKGLVNQEGSERPCKKKMIPCSAAASAEREADASSNARRPCITRAPRRSSATGSRQSLQEG
jgi:hypothetical protein